VTFFYLILLFTVIPLSGWMFYKAWNYHDKKIAEADENAINIISNAEARAWKIMKNAEAAMQQEVAKIKEDSYRLKLLEESLNEKAAQIEIKRLNLAKERELIESKNRKQNELLNTIKHIVMSDKEFKYDLKQRIRKILMENNI